jgi:hypothetical protein
MYCTETTEAFFFPDESPPTYNTNEENIIIKGLVVLKVIRRRQANHL